MGVCHTEWEPDVKADLGPASETARNKSSISEYAKPSEGLDLGLVGGWRRCRLSYSSVGQDVGRRAEYLSLCPFTMTAIWTEAPRASPHS